MRLGRFTKRLNEMDPQFNNASRIKAITENKDLAKDLKKLELHASKMPASSPMMIPVCYFHVHLPGQERKFMAEVTGANYYCLT